MRKNLNKEERKMIEYGVQFHPESIGTNVGQMIVDNFVGVCEQKN